MLSAYWSIWNTVTRKLGLAKPTAAELTLLILLERLLTRPAYLSGKLS